MTYPIVDQKILSPVPKSGLFGLRSRSRNTEEVPYPKAGQVLVYRTGGRYLLDNGRLELDDELVLQATHVCVVDTAQDRPVRVEFPIPSAEGSEFTVVVEFRCSVYDPVAVAENGQSDVREYLRGYVMSHEDVFKVGANYKLSAFHAARNDVRAELQAFAMHVPAQFPGMRVLLFHVDVPAPSELRRYVEKSVLDDLSHQDRIAELQREGTYGDVQAVQANDRDMLLLKLEIQKKELEILKLRSEREIDEQRERNAEAEQTAGHRRRAADNEFAIDQAAMIGEALGQNPLLAYGLAAQNGELSARELADLHQAEADRLHGLARLREDREHEAALGTTDWNRQMAAQATLARFDVVKSLIQQGHLDEKGIQELDGFLRDLASDRPAELTPRSEPRKEIPASAEDGREGEDGIDDVSVREEDL